MCELTLQMISLCNCSLSLNVCNIGLQCNLRFLSTTVLQGSVATLVNDGRIFNDFLIANLLLGVMVKEFWRSLRIWQSYLWPNCQTFRILKEIGAGEHDGDVRFTPEVEIWPFRACAMHPAIIIETVRSLWTGLWGRYHVPQNAFLVYDDAVYEVISISSIWWRRKAFGISKCSALYRE